MPSLSQVKNFKLPGVTHPIRVSLQVRIVCDCNTVIIILLWIHFMQCLTTKGVPFYMNSIPSIVQSCIGNPHISQAVQRYPVISTGPYWYVCLVVHCVHVLNVVVIISFLCSEMFHASRWLHDTRFYSPMAFLSNGNQAFVRDCVKCQHPVFGVVNCIVVKYYVVVSSIVGRKHA